MASRQFAWQMRKKAEGRCVICGRPASTRAHCRVHAMNATQWATRYQRAAFAADPDAFRAKRDARKAVSVAVASGQLVRPERCPRCGKADAKVTAHHADYSEPLVIAWLCYVCHAQVDGRKPTGRGK